MNWFKFAQYEDYLDDIEMRASRNPMPFKSWFPSGNRVYIPFNVGQSINPDIEVEQLLEQNNCMITDYRKGYCQQGNRQYRIGKFIQQLKNNAIKKLQQESNGQDISNEVMRLNQYYENILQKFTLSPIRQQSQSDEFQIVISQDPHDIAQMSTGRNWTSCMNLEDGAHAPDVYCEVESGGLVAYLIRSHDQNINDPLARIHIRRFENRHGQSIAMPEESVYGNSVPGFDEAVKSWIDSVQGQIQSGEYSLRGGQYSDSYMPNHLISPSTKEEIMEWYNGDHSDAEYTLYKVEDNLVDAYDMDFDSHNTGWFDDNHRLENFSHVFDNAEEAKEYFELIREQEEEDIGAREEADILADLDIHNTHPMDEENRNWTLENEEGEYVKPRFKLRELEHNNKDKMRSQAADLILDAEVGEFPIDVIEDIKNNAMSNPENIRNKRFLEKIFKKYPDLIEELEAQNMPMNQQLEYISQLKGEKKQPYVDSWYETIMHDLKEDDIFETPIMDRQVDEYINKAQESNIQSTKEIMMDNAYMHALDNLSTHVLNPINKVFDQIPENMISGLVETVSNIENYFGDRALTSNRMHADLTKTLSNKGADTPTVINYYKSLLPLWGFSRKLKLPDGKTVLEGSSINIYTLGTAISKLKENGRDFIPFLQNKLEEYRNLKSSTPNMLDHVIEHETVAIEHAIKALS